MKVKYIVEDLIQWRMNVLSKNELKYFKSFTVIPTTLHLSFNKEYTVLGIEYSKDGHVNFMVVDDTEVTYPKFYPSEFFEVSDNRMSKYWGNEFIGIYPSEKVVSPTLITFKEGVSDEYYFDKLINGETKAQEVFIKYKRLMENEFPDNNLKNAQIIDKNWLMCHYCDEVWESISTQGVVVCPKNKDRNNNPFWDMDTWNSLESCCA